MPLDLMPFLNPGAAEADARRANRRAQQQALRTATAAAQSQGAVNPAAMVGLQRDQIASMQGDAASRIQQARAQDRAAEAGAIQGLVGTGLSTLGTVGGLGIAANAGGGAQRPAQGQLGQQRRQQEDPLGILGTILGRGR